MPANDSTTTKEKILKKLRKALLQQNVLFNAELNYDSAIFAAESPDKLVAFAKNFKNAHGRFAFCHNEYHFLDRFLEVARAKGWKEISCLEEPLRKMFRRCGFYLLLNITEIAEAQVGICTCDALIGRTGSVVLSSANTLSRTISAYPPINVVIAYRNQVFSDLGSFFAKTDMDQLKTASALSIVTGPSRTADIEKTVVLGAHGPKELYVFYIDEDKTI